MFHSRISVIGGHNKDGNTDHLYDPLRKTFLQDTTAKKTFLDDVSRYSHITHLTAIHNYNENHQLGERTFIDEDRKLVRKNNITQIPDRSRYRIINAQQKQLSPISDEEFKRRMLANKQEEQVIVYTYGDEQEQYISEKVGQFEMPPPRKSSGLKITQPKYNLFSMIDEPLNNILSGKACTCPANQIIASNKSQVAWDLTDQK